MEKALLMTVGTGTRPDVYIVKPLVKSVKHSRPDFLVLVTSAVSREFGEAIARELNLNKDFYYIHTLQDPDDLQSIFQEVNGVIRDLNQRGFPPTTIELDFTSGTKAMSSGAVYSAIFNKCRSIKYITGPRRNGVVIDGAERFLGMEPSVIFAHHDLQLAIEMMKRFRFEIASEIIKKTNPDLFDPVERRKRDNLWSISNAYRSWDLFDHKLARSNYQEIDWKIGGLHCFKPSPEALEMLGELASQHGTPEMNGNLILMDLVNNAKRREIEGKYDDGVARLYRASEMLAQKILGGPPYTLNTGNIDLNRVPEFLRDKFEKNRNTEGSIAIGMTVAYELLEALGHPIGKKFMEDRSLQGRLKERNRSILAHGVKPASSVLFRKLHSNLLDLITMEIPDFSEKAKNLQFPWVDQSLNPDNHTIQRHHP
jgi:CRISPR-associated protein (TIGR02710 family)